MSLIREFAYPGGLSSGWSVIRLVSFIRLVSLIRRVSFIRLVSLIRVVAHQLRGFCVQVEQDSPFVSLYTRLGQLVHGQRGKKLAVSPYIDFNRSQLNATVAQHVQGFEAIANTRQVDVVAVQVRWARGHWWL